MTNEKSVKLYFILNDAEQTVNGLKCCLSQPSLLVFKSLSLFTLISIKYIDLQKERNIADAKITYQFSKIYSPFYHFIIMMIKVISILDPVFQLKMDGDVFLLKLSFILVLVHIQWLYALWRSLFPCIFADVLINAAPILPAKYKDMKGVRHKTKK